VGQPRTGSTLVERIITSHSAVHSAGELQQFRLSIRRLTAIAGRERLSPAIVAAAANLDPRQLGEAYLHAVRTLRGSTPRFVDKLPNNFLFLPLIAKALPNASIVHVTRAPMDACFASFKQLFADAYAHSYDQQEMARHFLRYHRLMEAWRACLGNRLIEVSYEALVSDVEPQTRRLVHALGLPWEDACLAFHRQDGAVSTASAVQVRTPAHTRSVGRWRRYETHLGPMRAALAAGGLPV
jgi:LPS sulfotransferase NodH